MNRSDYVNEKNKENYDRINLILPKGLKNEIQLKADKEGLSVTKYIQNLIFDDLNGLNRPEGKVDRPEVNESFKTRFFKDLRLATEFEELIDDVVMVGRYYVVRMKDGTEFRNTSKQLLRRELVEYRIGHKDETDGIEHLIKTTNLGRKYLQIIESCYKRDGIWTVKIKEGYVFRNGERVYQDTRMKSLYPEIVQIQKVYQKPLNLDE